MKLGYLRINQFRQFRQAVEIRKLDPGLNLFCGPNESGKSTIAAAIRAAFFERHRSSSVDDLRPWGDSGAAPEIELEFEHAGEAFRLKKRFLARKRCDLSIGEEILSGDEAEDRLAAMLGFQFPGRGASKSEYWGIPGLLWIEQGSGHELRSAVEFAGDHLKSVLGATLGEVTSSSGDEVLSHVEGELGELLTRTGKPRGRYREALEQVETLSQTLGDLDESVSRYQLQVDRLSELTAQQALDDVERPWEALRAQQAEAEAKYAQVQQLGELQSADEQALLKCRHHMQVVIEQLHGFQTQADELAERKSTRDVLHQQAEELAEQQLSTREALKQATTAYDLARAVDRASRQQAQRRGLELKRQTLSNQLVKLTSAFDQATALDATLQNQKRELAAVQLGDKKLERLQQLANALRDLEIRQQSIATVLEFDLDAEPRLILDGEVLSGKGERRLLQKTELHIKGIGKLTIAPGGQDLNELARQLDRAREQLAAELDAAQLDNIAQAVQRVEQTRALRTEINGNERMLGLHAPQGVGTLQQELALLREQVRQVETELLAQPAGDLTTDVIQPDVAEQQLEQASVALREAELAERQLQERLIQCQQALHTAEHECRQLEARLASPQRQQQERDCNETLTVLRHEQAQLEQGLDNRAKLIETARPDILQQDIKRFQASAAQLQLTNQQRKEEIIRLQSQLQAQDADGLEERRGKTAAEYASQRRRMQQFEQRAGALSLLASLLHSKRQALTRQLQAPLQKHLNHYLQLLFAQATLEVDEDLVPGQLVRAGQERGDFDLLSFGAREQMGLISRLAYADLLKEAGRPTLIILDDALVHSDAQRFAQMKRILFDAAQRHQILLFSCHPAHWRDMGVPIREIDSLRC
ncbi:AAA family ATPase [Pseudomonas sp. OIL-1]|uniref:AAA family ATPase n=1 Tax=Pseudomonas sp. OIL-1 TaxID=2706126 RepID=UPI0013A710D2|nr:AAA family ATPase [Pseudomonas sp. OIL-1]QIB52122.1 AAA family ATPase [Pseudomonas sp. OIL-1]